MEQEGIYVGLDVAKVQVDVAIRPGGDRCEVPNDEAGIAPLVASCRDSIRKLRCWRPQGTGVALVGSSGGRFPAGEGRHYLGGKLR